MDYLKLHNLYLKTTKDKTKPQIEKLAKKEWLNEKMWPSLPPLVFRMYTGFRIYSGLDDLTKSMIFLPNHATKKCLIMIIKLLNNLSCVLLRYSEFFPNWIHIEFLGMIIKNMHMISLIGYHWETVLFAEPKLILFCRHMSMPWA